MVERLLKKKKKFNGGALVDHKCISLKPIKVRDFEH